MQKKKYVTIIFIPRHMVIKKIWYDVYSANENGFAPQWILLRQGDTAWQVVLLFV